MALKKYKPTSPGRRFMSVSTFEEVTKTTPERSLTEPLKKTRRPQQHGPDHDAPPGRRPQAPLPRDRLQADEGRRAGEGRRDRVRPEPVGPDRAAPLPRRREGVHHRPRAAARRRDGRVGPDRRHQAGQRAPAREHPDRHDGAQRRAEAGAGRARWPARPARACSSWRRTTATASSGCRRARCAACR